MVIVQVLCQLKITNFICFLLENNCRILSFLIPLVKQYLSSVYLIFDSSFTFNSFSLLLQELRKFNYNCTFLFEELLNIEHLALPFCRFQIGSEVVSGHSNKTGHQQFFFVLSISCN